MQTVREIEVFTSLGKDVLLFHLMSGTERLGRLFEFELELLSDDSEIKFEDVLGQAMTVRLDLQGDKERFFHGLVTEFSYAGRLGRRALYRATLSPWLWFLTRTADCRIFQEKTVPDIIKEIFREHGFTDFEDALTRSYRTWDYCVQYRETDFNFVSRLMEQEGIYYYFTHEETKHSLVLADSYSSHEPIPGYDLVRYYPPDEQDRRESDHISEWVVSQRVQAGYCILNSFDFERPNAGLEVRSSVAREHAMADYEIYDYPGEYTQIADGEVYARCRIEEFQAEHEQAHGGGNVRGLYPGGLFSLDGFPRPDQDREYLVISIEHDLRGNPYESTSSADSEPVYLCSFTVIDAKQPYRSPRITPKPIVQGPQTAIVVGKSGEEIWPDKFGRVKVQFHWDRYGTHDENSSCWIRASQVHAGKGFGGIDLPRIGEEVIVSHLEGDPDRPIITGRVYNGANMPPTGLPGAAVVSGTKSNTVKGSGNNEISMDDTAGKENLKVNGQFDMNTTVGNNQNNTVSVDQTNTVGSNQTEEVGAKREVSIGADDKVTVGANRDTSISADHKVAVGGKEDLTIGGKSSLQVGGSRMEMIGGSHTIVNPKLTITSAANFTVAAGAKLTQTSPKVNLLAGSKFLASSGGKMDVKASAKLTQQSGAAMDIKSGAKLKMQSSAAMNLKSGAAMKSQASGAMSLKAGGAIKGKGSVIKLNSPTKIKGTTLTVS